MTHQNVQNSKHNHQLRKRRREVTARRSTVVFCSQLGTTMIISPLSMVGGSAPRAPWTTDGRWASASTTASPRATPTTSPTAWTTPYAGTATTTPPDWTPHMWVHSVSGVQKQWQVPRLLGLGRRCHAVSLRSILTLQNICHGGPTNLLYSKPASVVYFEYNGEWRTLPQDSFSFA